MSQLQQFLRGASKVSYDNTTSGLTAATVQAALDEIDGLADGAIADIADIRTTQGTSDGDTNLGTFTGVTIPDSSTVKGALQAVETAYEETDQNVDDLITLSGVPENSTDLSTFTGSTIPDNVAVKPALQSLETSVETKANDADVIKKDGSVSFTGNQSMGSFRLTDLAAPVGANDAARLADVQAASAGQSSKEPVDVVSTSNITLSGEQTIDGVLTAGSRVLVGGQTNQNDNGIYVSAAGAWARATDHDGNPDGEIARGNTTLVLSGTNNANTVYILNATDAADPTDITAGSETQNWIIYSRAESITAGDGLAKSGLDLSVNVDDATIELNADALRVKADGINDTHIDFGTGANQVSAVDIPIADGGGLITATEVEGALAENRGAIDAIEDNTLTSPTGSLTTGGTIGADDQTAEVAFSTVGAANRSIEASSLASTTASQGAGMVGINDAGGLITATTVEGALAENRGAIDAIEDNTITSPNGSVTVAGTVGGDDQTIDVNYSTTGAANRSIQASDLASTTNGEGASMVGVEDAAGNWTSTDVEGVLVEVDTRLDALESGGTLDWQIKTAAHTAADGEKLLVDTTSAAVTITLPATPSAGDEVIVRDAKRTSETNAITVGRNGSNIGGLAEDMTIQINGIQAHLVYVDAGHGWSVEAS